MKQHFLGWKHRENPKTVSDPSSGVYKGGQWGVAQSDPFKIKQDGDTLCPRQETTCFWWKILKQIVDKGHIGN